MATQQRVALAPVTERPHRVEAISPRERAIIYGDVSALDERGRMEYLKALCEATGLNPMTRPFGYLVDKQGKHTVYLTAGGGAQLRLKHGVGIDKVEDLGLVNGFYRVNVYGHAGNGRPDVEFGSVKPISYQGQDPSAEAVEIARKKSLTQGKTRLSKSLTGMAGIPSEEELESIPGVRIAEGTPSLLVEGETTTSTDRETGEVTTTQAAPRRPDSSLIGAIYREFEKLVETVREELQAEVPIPEGMDVTRATRFKEGIASRLAERRAERVAAALVHPDDEAADEALGADAEDQEPPL